MAAVEAPGAEKPRLYVDLAESEADIRESQQLRYRIFAEELGAEVKGAEQAIDEDNFDAYCHHLLVRESDTGRVIGSTRLLTDEQAAKSGGFYSETEFDITSILALPGKRLEVGRTCIDSEYRQGAAIAVLWSGLAGFVAVHGFDLLFGCASIELEDGGIRANAIIQRLRQHSMSDLAKVEPKIPLKHISVEPNVTVPMPPLLKAYVRLGAKACGEAFFDEAFNVADVLMLLDVDTLNPSYSRHFLERATRG